MSKITKIFLLWLICVSTCFAESIGKQLHQAILYNDIDHVKQLLAKKPNLEPKCPYHFDCKPLVYAAALGRFEIIKLLVTVGADVNGIGAYKSVPLIQTASAGTNYRQPGVPKGATKQTIKDIRIYLLNHGANPNIINAFGRSFFMGIIAECDIDLIKLSIEKGANTNAVFRNTRMISSDGNTPLHIAIESKCHDAIPILLSSRADKTIKNEQGLTSLDLALKLSDQRSIKILSDK